MSVGNDYEPALSKSGLPDLRALGAGFSSAYLPCVGKVSVAVNFPAVIAHKKVPMFNFMGTFLFYLSTQDSQWVMLAIRSSGKRRS